MFLLRKKAENNTLEMPISVALGESKGGNVEEILEFPIQRSVTRLNGAYFYNYAHGYKKLGADEIKLAAIAKAKVGLKFVEGNNIDLFTPTSLETARNTAYEFLKQNLPENRAFLLSHLVANDVVGYGAISLLLEDKKNIEEIEVNSPTAEIIIYNTKYGRCKTNLSYINEIEFRRAINKLLYFAEKELNNNNPIIDAQIGEMRVHAQIKPYAHAGACTSIRIGGRKEFNMIKLIENGTVSPEVLAYIWLAIDSKANIIISGAPASGKTTLLASLISLVPRYLKVITIEEETNELQPFASYNIVSLYSSKKNFTSQQQVVNALRMRPDRIIIGEIRGEEAKEVFSGSNLGIPFITTMHSNEGGLDILKRLMIRPMGVETNALSALDITLYMEQKGLSRRQLGKIFEYKWLSRGEISEEEGIIVDDIDKVEIKEVATNGLLNPEKMENSKIFDIFARQKDISKKKVFDEFGKRVAFINDAVKSNQDLEKKITQYNPGA
ncbi:MAG: ATPase, T2SS/T4P/T4SS family [Candidatus Micrarchaeia archaeon]